MLELKAISYTNIGPFEGKTKTVVFEKGKFLIKAPMGSGKSFLFFDGPVYALYKHSTRNMVNNNSKSGSIALIFCVDGLSYLLVRKLKNGKSKDTCQSQLFLLHDGYSFAGGSVLRDDYDVVENLRLQGAIAEEQIFKNETDLQANILNLLPPREVFLSTIFLLQDAPNIFELMPAERVVIFKNVFGLLGIDEAKDILGERKREIQTIRKVKSDDERFNTKLRSHLLGLIASFKALEQHQSSHAVVSGSKQIIDERECFVDNLHIGHFGLDGLDQKTVSGIVDHIAVLTSEFDMMKNQFLEQTKRLDAEGKEYDLLLAKKTDLIARMAQLQTAIGQVDLSHLTNLKSEKQSLRSQQLVLEAALPHAMHQEFVAGHSEVVEVLGTSSPATLPGRQSLVEKVIAQGKHIAEQNNAYEQRIQDITKQKNSYEEHMQQLALNPGTKAYARMQQLVEQHTTLLQEKRSSYLKDLHQKEEKIHNHHHECEQLDKKIHNYLTSIQSESVFQCDKIDSVCPYIAMINSKSLKELEAQMAVLLNDKQMKEKTFADQDVEGSVVAIKQKIQDIDQKIAAYATKPVESLTDFVGELEKEKRDLIKKIEDEGLDHTLVQLAQSTSKNNQQLSLLKLFLQQSDWKTINENHEKHMEYEKKVRLLEHEISVLESAQNKIESLQQDLAVATRELALTDELITKQEALVGELTLKLEDMRTKLADDTYKDLASAQAAAKALDQHYRSVDEVVKEYKQSKQEVEALIAQEKRLTNLYNIFSKELLFLVLDNSIPLLNEIINSYLSQIVDYSLNMNIVDDGGQIRMEAKIVDAKGERDVSALSGGQKTILKLVWMLSVSSFMRSPMLFLDETINNLDSDAISLVADMLEDFVRKHDMSFYTVTHSQQIQEMSIWDGVVVV